MTELVLLARELQSFIESRGWRFCFIGGLALQRWGEPRMTRDVDLTLITGFGDEEKYVDDFLLHYASRRTDMREFALRYRVMLLQDPEGLPFDIALGGLPFEVEAVERSSLHDYMPGVSLRTCSAEDLIVMKAFADRDQDWIDVRGIAIRQRGKVDWEYAITALRPLCEAKEAPEIVNRLSEIKDCCS